MAVNAMGHLMGEQGRQLGFVIHASQHTGVDIDDAIGKGKGVKIRVLNNHYFK